MELMASQQILRVGKLRAPYITLRTNSGEASAPDWDWSAITLSPLTEKSMSFPMTVGLQEMSRFPILLNHIKNNLKHY